MFQLRASFGSSVWLRLSFPVAASKAVVLLSSGRSGKAAREEVVETVKREDQKVL